MRVLVALGMMLGGAAYAANLVTTDFDSLASGDTTATALNGITSGGTWALGSTTNVHQEIHTDAGGGSKALFSGSHVEGETATGPGATLTLDTPVAVADLSLGNDLVFSFKTGTSVKTGFNINAYWYILDDLGATLAVIKLDDGAISLTGSGGNIPLFSQGNVVGASWDSSDNDVITMTITIDSTGALTVEVEDVDSSGSKTKNIGTGVTVASLRTSWEANKGQGVYLNDVLVTGPTGDPEVRLSDDSVAENDPVGTVVGTLSVADPAGSGPFVYDFADTGTFPDNSSFTIDGDELKLAVVPDFEVKSTYNIRIQETSEAITNDFTITVTDDNNEPFGIYVHGEVKTGETGWAVGSVQALKGENVQVTYSIDTSTFTDGETNFDINPLSGDLTLAVQAGAVGTIYWVEVKATGSHDASESNVIIRVESVAIAPAATVIRIR